MRLLLLTSAALLCATAVPTWAFSLSSFFGAPSTNTEQKPYLHPLSPPEREPLSSRAKRQAYQVYVDGDVSVTVDKSGQKETGNWGPWAAEQQCSRTCGGGVQVEKRQCSGQCTGASVRYVSCNLEECPAGQDFRAEQCSKYNDEPLDGNYHKWTPYKGKNKCELVCKPESGNFYYKWADKVVDGTRCDSKSNDICVDGECLPVGCDGKLGSSLKYDKCGKCDGDGSTCKTIEGFFDERNLAPGYHDIIKLPEGATNIKIQEARKSTNNLALKNSSDHFYLNGNGLIQVEKEVDVAGTIFVYDDAEPETLTARGPLNEELTVALLFRKGSRDTAIKYEFSIPLDEEVDYMYKFDAWTPCSVTCGKGEQTRNLYCVDGKNKGRVEDDLCEENNATKPEFQKSCETVDCEAEWFTAEWEPCSATCGDQGQQYRVVYCHQVFANGRRVTVDDGNCTASRPPVKQTCNRFACPEWQAGPWSACSEKCGDAHQYRSVTCRSEKEGEEGKLLPAEACPAEEKQKEKFETERTCNLGPCEGLSFVTGEWNLCTKCNDTEETREVTCKDTQGRAYPLEKCLVDNSTEIPADTRSCATQPPCNYEWTVSEWSKCSTECGHGHKTRRVICAIHQNGGLEVVGEFHCQAEKPEIKTNCTNEEKCHGTWYTSSWSNCTAECGGGTQERVAVCLNYDKKPVPTWCDELLKPTENQECNVEDCPTCFDSEFGCCPDNSTFATGEFNFGCSNCSETKFGCCADNVTLATGPNSQGCDEFMESPLNLELEGADGAAEGDEASGEAPALLAGSAADDGAICNVTNANGDEASVECSTILPNATLLDSDLLEGENATIHCSKTEFGCCPDWYTPASGKNNEGCDSFVLGNCNETQFGCCHDEVTLARGPNLEGCGEPSCAASLYGCCKDRKTIAFGPHYAGCERSSFPCELSDFGCCPDGETAALGKNGTGCGENCLTTKFGCCPDGKTTAKGSHNQGCGCEFAQYGCCPDGKSPAKGAGFYGCPESCAQSQFGCCPDGKTRARGENKEGCPCQYTRYGCCPDGETTALGPRNDGCDDCRYAKHGCCPDGETKALGPDNAGCPSTTLAPFMQGGTVSPHKIVSCNQPQDAGNVCGSGYKLTWYYDAAEGRCSQFWFGGCGGNENKFSTKEMCETICVEPPGKGRCYLPKIEGPLRCDQPQPRYWYDHSTKQCAAFWWRGCLGNSNNFASWEECSTFCKNVGPYDEPTTPAPPPPTRPSAQQSFFAPTADAAQISIVPQQPDQSGQQQQQQQPPRPAQSMEDVCRSPQDAGPCETYTEQFYYNAFSKQCEAFTYGGCGGNLNRFRTKDDCEQRCFFVHGAQPSNPRAAPAAQPIQQQPPAGSDPRIVSPPQFPVDPRQPAAAASPVIIPSSSISKQREVCHLNMDQGRCKGAFDSWYYEPATGSCVTFKYTGCGGNANRFANKDQCEQLCVKPLAEAQGAQGASGVDGPAGSNSVCDEAKDTGPCTNFATKWYFNQTDGTCNRFHYGGCQGTSNRFDNEQQCKAACSNHKDACSLPKVQGPCSGKHSYYYFNSASQQCETFIYGGCLGNTNRFATIEECQARCPRVSTTTTTTTLAPSPPTTEIPSSSKYEVIQQELPSLSLRYSFAHSKRRDSPMTRSVSAHFERHNYPQNDDPRVVHEDRVADCYAVPDPGSCGDYRLVWHYSAKGNTCRQFYYGGCAGNTNRFETRENCELMCVQKITERVEEVTEKSSSLEEVRLTDIRADNDEGKLEEYTIHKGHVISDNEALPELCQLPEQRGSCYDNILRWRYNADKSECVSFMYSGCDANANHFTSQETCERACGKYRTVDVCGEPKDQGSCNLAIPRWYYIRDITQCRMMMWTGCGGNGNSFSSKEECESLCRAEASWYTVTRELDTCQLPRSFGPCTDSISMWYFDMSETECKPFTYGGCRGNQNRFVSKEQCQQRCQASDGSLKKLNAEEMCRLPAEAGPCRLGIQKYFYDPYTQTCQTFHYGGCEGNTNRFDTELDCYRVCSSIKSEPAEQHIPQLSHSTTPIIYVLGKNPILSGTTFRIRCNTYGVVPVTWYKNGGILQFGSRITEENDDTLEFVDALTSDAGVYSCIAGHESEMSEGVEVVIKRAPTTTIVYTRKPFVPTVATIAPIATTATTNTTNTTPALFSTSAATSIHRNPTHSSSSSGCVDIGNAGTCSLIVKNGLCTKKRYGTFCCRTCTKLNFKF